MIRHTIKPDHSAMQTVIMSGNGTLGLKLVNNPIGLPALKIVDICDTPWNATHEIIDNATVQVIMGFTTLEGLETIQSYMDVIHDYLTEAEKTNKLRLKP